jgi:putative endonuclease
MASVPERAWHAYLVRCGDGSLYAGATNDVKRRVAQHASGRGARYTRSRPPVVLAWRSPPLDKRAAHRLEARLKRLTRDEKLAITERRATALLRRLLAESR